MSCCQVCGKTNDLSLCGRCKSASRGAYCSKEHQIADWHRHRRWCAENNVTTINTNASSINSAPVLNLKQKILTVQESNTSTSSTTTPTVTLSNFDHLMTQQHLQLQHQLDIKQQPSTSTLLLNNNNDNSVLNQGCNDQFDQFVARFDQTHFNSIVENQTQPEEISMFNNQPVNTEEASTVTMEEIFCANQINPQVLNMQTSTVSCLKNIADAPQNGNYTNITIPMPSNNNTNNNNNSSNNNIMNNNVINNNAAAVSADNGQQSAASNYPLPRHNYNDLVGISDECRDIAFRSLLPYSNIVLNDMNRYGFCVIDDFIKNGDAILNEVSHLYNLGCFREGQVLNAKANSFSSMIRGDQIVWVEGTESYCNQIGFLIRILDSVIYRCNTSLSMGEFLKYKIRKRTKAMIACYPGNFSRYVRHIDNPNHDGRCITSIFYLNKDFNRDRDGGVLRLFPQMLNGIVADITPLFNRVIFFWSDRRNPHEVMPSLRLRFAITVWYFDNEEREKVLQNYRNNGLACPIDRDLKPFIFE